MNKNQPASQPPIKQPEVPAKTPDEKMTVEFVPFGATDKIKLTATMVAEFVAVPTRSGKKPTMRDCVKFLMLCRGKRANPFEGDCYMIGYDNQDGTATFSIVCGVELFLKRAEQNSDYDGSESGVIVSTAEGVTERQGSLVFKNETLEGGWAKVYDRKHTRPVYKAVKFATYDTGRSRWQKDPGGMIAKVALSQALRDRYPTALGGLYTQEEMQRVTESGDGLLIPDNCKKAPEVMPRRLGEPHPQAEPAPAPEPDEGFENFKSSVYDCCAELDGIDCDAEIFKAIGVMGGAESVPVEKRKDVLAHFEKMLNPGKK